MLLKTYQENEIMNQHPCFNDNTHRLVGRVHLPVASHCNVQCNFCERNICVANEIHHPGWTAKILSVTESIDLIHSIMLQKMEYFFVVGIAGPGDPLANSQTFETLDLIHREYPHLPKCLCTNGLLLEDKLIDILNVGIKALTVTVNAADNQTGKDIYSWINYKGNIYRGEEAVDLLLEKQYKGIRKAVEADLTVKINTVLIPGVNDKQMPKLATYLKEAGAKIMNIIPLIPSGKMKNWLSPSREEIRKARLECEKIIPQFHCCEQCRADIIYLP